MPLLRRYCSSNSGDDENDENDDDEEEERDALALAALKVAAFLTLPPGAPNAASPLWLAQADAAAAAAEAFAAPGALGAAAELAGRALARAAGGEAGGDNRSDEKFSDADASSLQLVLTLCRNLLAAPVAAGKGGSGSVARASAAASLRSRLVARLSESALLDLVLACGSILNGNGNGSGSCCGPEAARALRADAPLLLAAMHAALDGVDAGTLDAALAASEGASATAAAAAAAAKAKGKGEEKEGAEGAFARAAAADENAPPLRSAPLVPPRRLVPRGLRAPVDEATASRRSSRGGAERELELLRAERTAQARVLGRVRQAHFGGGGDFPRQLGKQYGALFILRTFAVHDVLKLGMTGHGLVQTWF